MTKTYTLSPQFKIKGVEGKIGEISSQISFESLHPIIMAFGEGENRFYWVFTSQEGQQVLPGTKHALIILDVPRGTKSVHGKIYCEALISQKLFAELLPKRVETDHYAIDWNLTEAKPLY